MSNLIEVTNNYVELYTGLLNSMDDNGVVDFDLAAAVQEAKGTFEEKALAVATVYRKKDIDVKLIDEEIARLTDIKNRIECEKESVKQYLATACETAGIDSIKGVYASVKFNNNPPHVVITDESKIPDEYRVTKTTVEISKKKIAEALKSGIDVSGARLESTKSFQIK